MIDNERAVSLLYTLKKLKKNKSKRDIAKSTTNVDAYDDSQITLNLAGTVN